MRKGGTDFSDLVVDFRGGNPEREKRSGKSDVVCRLREFTRRRRTARGRRRD